MTQESGYPLTRYFGTFGENPKTDVRATGLLFDLQHVPLGSVEPQLVPDVGYREVEVDHSSGAVRFRLEETPRRRFSFIRLDKLRN